MADKTRPHFTAFLGPQRLAAGPLAEVAIAVMQASRRPAAPPIIIFSDATGQPIDLDLRGTEREIIARLPQPASPPESKPKRRRQRSRAGADGPSSALSRAR